MKSSVRVFSSAQTELMIDDLLGQVLTDVFVKLITAEKLWQNCSEKVFNIFQHTHTINELFLSSCSEFDSPNRIQNPIAPRTTSKNRPKSMVGWARATNYPPLNVFCATRPRQIISFLSSLMLLWHQTRLKHCVSKAQKTQNKTRETLCFGLPPVEWWK